MRTKIFEYMVEFFVVVVSGDVFAFVIGIVFAAVVGVAIWIVGSVFLFLLFSVCHGCCGKSLCIRLICS